MKKEIIFTAIGIAIVGFGVFYFMNRSQTSEEVLTVDTTQTAQTYEEQEAPQDSQPIVDKTKTLLGKSALGNDVLAYHYGDGAKEILFVGGIHGGYEWNTSLLAYEFMDYLSSNPNTVPSNLKVTVIPAMNPDGLIKAVGTSERFTKADVSTSDATLIAGRFNGNNVDLNRNFDCVWKKEGVWLDRKVSGGSAPFSEPESQAFKNYIESSSPAAVIVWYSSADGVYASSCEGGILEETRTLANVYANASKYNMHDEFNYYELTGDMVNWLAKKNIPGISVLLSTHQDTELNKNLLGIKAVLAHYAR